MAVVLNVIFQETDNIINEISTYHGNTRKPIVYWSIFRKHSFNVLILSCLFGENVLKLLFSQAIEIRTKTQLQQLQICQASTKPTQNSITELEKPIYSEVLFLSSKCKFPIFIHQICSSIPYFSSVFYSYNTTDNYTTKSCLHQNINYTLAFLKKFCQLKVLFCGEKLYCFLKSKATLASTLNLKKCSQKTSRIS